MIVVADTSPVTALLHLKQLNLLGMLYGPVYIPVTVATELKTLTAFGYDISFLLQQDKYIVLQASDTKLIAALMMHIDAGEAEAIALAKELNAELLLIDEKLGKEYATAENINCKGVIGILIAAKKEGMIPLLTPLLDDLVNNLKFRIADKI